MHSIISPAAVLNEDKFLLRRCLIMKKWEGTTMQLKHSSSKHVQCKDLTPFPLVVRNFEIIGEASKYVPDSIKGAYKDVDWQAIIGLRNRITHEYFGISLAIIWHIIKKELPKLKQQMKEILKQYKQ